MAALARLPADPRALAAALPDLPRWVETRGLLLSGAAIVRPGASAGDALVLDPVLPAGYLVGQVDAALLQDALHGVSVDFELVVQIDALDAARASLSGWRVVTATVLSPARP